ncbi:MAG: TonB-dependent receptor [Saprospiraceae bacterium]|nr:TonB-dependent receptor [Saprospiraceae bacterium]MBP7699309.1 TonB-dependent receptor [Saprospiraceae bacterium]
MIKFSQSLSDKILPIIVFQLLSLKVLAQTATIVGTVTDISNSQPVDFANVYVQGTTFATETVLDGAYKLTVPANKKITIIYSRLGYKEGRTTLTLKPDETVTLAVQLSLEESKFEIEIRESRIDDKGLIREKVEAFKLLPSVSGNFESALPSIALGTSSGTGGELSSQYNVRGGNYDENLVYVNDFEIYRPQLIRTGQQEGLTFPNIDLMRDLSFSSGGFQAQYGDKMSSVLDIRYKRPDSLRASASVSLLGGTAHLEGSFRTAKDNYRKVRYLLGARYKTTQYLLGSLDVKGEYTPNFFDFQGYVTYDINSDWQVALIGNYNSSVYQFTPISRSTASGLIDFALSLRTAFEGGEIDDFKTQMGGASLTYLPNRKRNPYFIKFLTFTYLSKENERFDIIGDYILGEIESNIGSNNFGEIVSVLGTGTQHQYVRNYLTAQVANAEVKGGIELQSNNNESSHFLQSGIKFQHEDIFDKLNEWERLDSALYSLPYNPEILQLRNVLKTQNSLQSQRISAYVQDTYTYKKREKYELQATVGVRAQHWTLNQETVISPRVQLLYQPLNKKNDISYRLAGGLYYQPPFYRELRNLQGIVNHDVQAQKSMHILGGITYDFYLGKNTPKKFRFITEAYYKKLWDLVSYDVDNVRIRYAGKNNAIGYVAGLDMRLNGEFVPGAESWINLSLLRARERLDGIQHLKREFGKPDSILVNDVPRPTDQFATFAIFFQDYLPKNKNLKMNLNLTLGTGLPYGILGNNEIYRNTYRFQAYHRVDIGFSAKFWEDSWRERRPKHPLRFTRNTWLSLEVFNLLKVLNVASNTWIKTVYNSQYAIPNYLTSRRINLRLRVEF